MLASIKYLQVHRIHLIDYFRVNKTLSPLVSIRLICIGYRSRMDPAT